MQSIEFKFNIMDKVNITELKRPGRVLALFVDSGGMRYRVRYFQDGSANDDYFYSDEITLK